MTIVPQLHMLYDKIGFVIKGKVNEGRTPRTRPSSNDRKLHKAPKRFLKKVNYLNKR